VKTDLFCKSEHRSRRSGRLGFSPQSYQYSSGGYEYETMGRVTFEDVIGCKMQEEKNTEDIY
jgi:hypothetical protein